MSLQELWKMPKVPSGKPQPMTDFRIAPATSSEIPGCAGCAFTITGHRAAKADRIAVGDRKGQREVGGSKNRDWSKRDLAEPQVGAASGDPIRQ